MLSAGRLCQIGAEAVFVTTFEECIPFPLLFLDGAPPPLIPVVVIIGVLFFGFHPYPRYSSAPHGLSSYSASTKTAIFDPV